MKVDKLPKRFDALSVSISLFYFCLCLWIELKMILILKQIVYALPLDLN